MPAGSKDRSRHSNRFFQTTRWSLVLAACREASPDSRAALSDLCQAYWFPLYSYVRRRVQSEDEALDLTQAFFATFLEKNYITQAKPERGKFRAFLLTAFKHFLSKEWDKWKAKKRGGGSSAISLDFDRQNELYAIELTDELTPEQIYERQWAVTLLNLVLKRLRNEYLAEEKLEVFDRLEGLIFQQGSEETYAKISQETGIAGSALRMTASRIRKRFKSLLREEIDRTVTSPEEVDREIIGLFTVLASKSEKNFVALSRKSVIED